MRLCVSCRSATTYSQSDKVYDRQRQCNTDIRSIDQLGFINTSLIRHYCDILSVLLPRLLAIKQWAPPLGFNSQAGAPEEPISFSSYAPAIMTRGAEASLTLLTPLRWGPLPNLQEGTQFTEGKLGYSDYILAKHKRESDVMLGGRKYKIGCHPGRSR